LGRGFNQTHNEQASVVALARTLLQGVDRTRPESKVATPTLELILETVIALGSASKHVDLRQNIQEQNLSTSFEAVAKARREIAERQAIERETLERQMDEED
jgi:hypothetical protein